MFLCSKVTFLRGLAKEYTKLSSMMMIGISRFMFRSLTDRFDTLRTMKVCRFYTKRFGFKKEPSNMMVNRLRHNILKGYWLSSPEIAWVVFQLDTMGNAFPRLFLMTAARWYICLCLKYFLWRDSFVGKTVLLKITVLWRICFTRGITLCSGLVLWIICFADENNSLKKPILWRNLFIWISQFVKKHSFIAKLVRWRN